MRNGVMCKNEKQFGHWLRVILKNYGKIYYVHNLMPFYQNSLRDRNNCELFENIKCISKISKITVY